MVGGEITAAGGRLCWRVGSGCTVEIFDIEVDSVSRRTGVGRRMVDRLLKEQLPPGCTLVWAITRSTNLIAQEFYEALGFRVVGVLRNFYKDEFGTANLADAVMYGRDIKPPRG